MVKTCYLKTHNILFKRSIEAAGINIVNEVNKAINDGYKRFVAGADGEIDLIFAKAVYDMKDTYPDIKLELEISSREYIDKINENPVFKKIFYMCDAVFMGQNKNGKHYIKDSEILTDIRYINL